MFVDRIGNQLFHGAYVHYKRDLSNNTPMPEGFPDEIDGWIFCNGNRVFLYTNDVRNSMIFTGIYWDLDDDPLWELELNWWDLEF